MPISRARACLLPRDARATRTDRTRLEERLADLETGAHAWSVIVYSVRDPDLSPDCPLGEALDVFVRREDAERFIDDVQRDEPVLGRLLWIEAVELHACDSLN